MSVLSRSLAILALASGLAVAASEPARADSFTFGFSIGDRDDGWRRGGDRHDPRHRHRGHRQRGHHPYGPPPWVRYHPAPPRYYVPHCQPVWGPWHQASVTVCR